MNKKHIAVIGAGVLIAGLTIGGLSFAKSDREGLREGTIRPGHQSEADFPSLAKVTPDQAVQSALGAENGKVLKTELENENGFLVYGVEIVTADKSIVDVKVDAGSGKVLAKDRDTDDENGRSGRSGDREDRDSEGHGSDRGHDK
jgi:hypothetical protein